MKVRQGLLKFISTDTPETVKLAITGGEPTEPPLEPEDEVTVLFVLSHDRSQSVSEAAKRRLEELPTYVILAALDKKLDPLVIKAVVNLRKDDEAILMMAVFNESIDDETLRRLASEGPEEVIAVIAEDHTLLLRKPFLMDALKKNPLTSQAIIRDLDLLASSPAEAAAVKAEASSAGAPKENELKIDEQNIYKSVKEMSMGQKIKLALSGNKSAREFLVKDANKIIALAVLKNPRITEDEVQRVISSKGTPEDLLRQIARNKEWVKSYSIKLGMVVNPKTPLAISVKFLDSIYEKDLQKLSKSKNVPSVIAAAARRKIEAKIKK